jgi:hypothetical protein
MLLNGPCGPVATMPGRPFTGVILNSTPGSGDCAEEGRHLVGTNDRPQRGLGLPSGIAVQDNLGRKHGEQLADVSSQACRQESLGCGPRSLLVGAVARTPFGDVLAGTMVELPHCGRCTPEDLGDLLGCPGEGLPEDEHGPLEGERLSKTNSIPTETLSRSSMTCAGSGSTLTGSGSQEPGFSSLRRCRRRSRSMAARTVTRRSHPSSESTFAACASHRGQTSCTRSSASVQDPRIR